MKKNLTALAVITLMPLFVSTVWSSGDKKIGEDEGPQSGVKTHSQTSCFPQLRDWFKSRKNKQTRQNRVDNDNEHGRGRVDTTVTTPTLSNEPFNNGQGSSTGNTNKTTDEHKIEVPSTTPITQPVVNKPKDESSTAEVSKQGKPTSIDQDSKEPEKKDKKSPNILVRDEASKTSLNGSHDTVVNQQPAASTTGTEEPKVNNQPKNTEVTTTEVKPGTTGSGSTQKQSIKKIGKGLQETAKGKEKK